MPEHPEQAPESIQFPERIGQNFELWQEYYEVHGPEAYKYRRLYEETSRQLSDIYRYAEEHGIDLPSPGPDFV